MTLPRGRPVSAIALFLRRGLGVWCLWALGVPGMVCASASAEVAVRRQNFVMGTWLTVRVEADTRTVAVAASESVLRAVQKAETRLSTWRDDSELAGLNRTRPGEWVALDRFLARDLEVARRWEALTGGAFRLGVGALVSVWQLRGSGRVPEEADRLAAVEAARPEGMELVGYRWRRTTEAYELEEGGFGKGAALIDAVAAARIAGVACVIADFGGQVVVDGECAFVRIGIADPGNRQAEIASFQIDGGSVATSGSSEKGILIDGVRYGHVLDPKSGQPVEDWGSVTVVATDSLTADCVSTALYVMGPREGSRWVVDHPELEAVFVERTENGLRIAATAGLAGKLVPQSGRTIQWLGPPGDGAIGEQRAEENLERLRKITPGNRFGSR